jgi:sugar phosphate isomerase/epimerase
MNRRSFLQVVPLAAGLPAILQGIPPRASLEGELGITTGSFMRNITAGKFRLLDLPRLMRDELDMRVMDLMTATLASMEPAYLDQLRGAAENAGCILTNLKMNQKGLEMASPDDAVRKQAMDIYKGTIDAAKRLGVRWVRPLPGAKKPDSKLLITAYRELMDYAGERGIGVLIENFGWMQGDADALPAVIKEVGDGLHSQPDTGNWTDAARYDGLAKAFPFAASCDFKAKEMEADGTHKDYDLKRCFDIGWKAGFRGPWCFEHFNDDLAKLFKDFGMLRDMLQRWMKEAEVGKP